MKRSNSKAPPTAHELEYIEASETGHHASRKLYVLDDFPGFWRFVTGTRDQTAQERFPKCMSVWHDGGIKFAVMDAPATQEAFEAVTVPPTPEPPPALPPLPEWLRAKDEAAKPKEPPFDVGGEG